MSISSAHAPFLARMAIDQLRRCWPLLNESLKAELVALFEPQAHGFRDDSLHRHRESAQQGTPFDLATRRASFPVATCSFCSTPGQTLGACCVNCGEQV